MPVTHFRATSAQEPREASACADAIPYPYASGESVSSGWECATGEAGDVGGGAQEQQQHHPSEGITGRFPAEGFGPPQGHNQQHSTPQSSVDVAVEPSGEAELAPCRHQSAHVLDGLPAADDERRRIARVRELYAKQDRARAAALSTARSLSSSTAITSRYAYSSRDSSSSISPLPSPRKSVGEGHFSTTSNQGPARRRQARRVGSNGIPANNTNNALSPTSLYHGVNPATSAGGGRGVEVVFCMHYWTRWGQSVKIVGATPEVGLWRPENAVDLHWQGGGVWGAQVFVNPGALPLQYKYVVVEGNDVIWERGLNRVLTPEAIVSTSAPLVGSSSAAATTARTSSVGPDCVMRLTEFWGHPEATVTSKLVLRRPGPAIDPASCAGLA
eukprot:GHVU01232230.1.p1 GENE.GHVU01232230.1~~GHVU01232230.1.p1  ORF type:complete len:387 (-),score=30.51 GHVU01232230.1:1056-2216(-)